MPRVNAAAGADHPLLAPLVKGAGPATPPVAYLPLTSLTAGLVLRAHSRLPVTCLPPPAPRPEAPPPGSLLAPSPPARSFFPVPLCLPGHTHHPVAGAAASATTATTPRASGLGRLVCLARTEPLPSLPFRSPARLRPLQQQQQQPRLSRRGHGSFKSPSRSVPRTPPFFLSSLPGQPSCLG